MEPWATVQGFSTYGAQITEPHRMSKVRTVAFVDGFNLYHAVADLQENHLKWLDLHLLCRHFAPNGGYDLARVLYFTALATWRPDSYRRHLAYIGALETVGVEVIKSKFKKKYRKCFACGNQWTHHEEKETDVSIGVQLVDLAYRGEFDRALLISADSDLSPAVRTVTRRFPEKSIQIVTPPGRNPSHELLGASANAGSKIKRIHLQRSLLPGVVTSTDGSKINRPSAYRP